MIRSTRTVAKGNMFKIKTNGRNKKCSNSQKFSLGQQQNYPKHETQKIREKSTGVFN